MKIYINSWFDRFTYKNNIADKDLIKVLERVEKGLIDADLGGSEIKQRIARKGQSSAKGFRTIIIIKEPEKCFFVYGYSKSERSNITKSETKEFKKLAASMLKISEKQIQELIEIGDLFEVKRQ